MSGWIKFEKSLDNDPRVLKMARGLRDRLASTLGCNASALPAVTLVCGALARLWIYADTHIRDDDTLDVGADGIDELVGIAGFARLCPPEWLVIVDDEHVELPRYHEHNGTEAKKRALTQKRVEHHRERVKRESVEVCNASALPDLDQTKTRPTLKNPSAAVPPTEPPRRDVSRQTDPDWLLEFKLAYPHRAGDQGWRRAMKAANARMAEGHSPQEFIAGARRYAEFCEAGGKTGTEYVKQAATFLGPEKSFLLPWRPPPKAESATERMLRNLNGLENGRVIEHERDQYPIAS